MADKKKYLDLTGLGKYNDLVKAELAKKVNVESGKGLSTEDFTTALKTKLEGVSAGAQVNVIETVKVNGTALSVTSKGVNVTVPTKVSELTNDSNYLVAADIAGKVDAVEGKSLTSNDLTDELKGKYDGAVTKVAALEAVGAQANEIETISVNGVNVAPDTNKNVAIVISKNLSDYTNDANFLVAADIADKVDKVEGKGLSSNDYTDAEKNKLAAIAANAQVNKIESVKVDGTALTITDKAVNIDLSGKVDVVSGKGLSTNDYTTDEKNKLGAIAAGAQVNVIETVKVNDTALTVSGKAVNISVPTKVSQITNDSNYQTDTEVSAAIAAAVSGITSFEYEVVTALPTTGVKGKVYLKSATGAAGQNIYEEFIWVNSKYEMLGTTEMDLSAYAKTADFESISEEEINALFPAA